jgi:hypothetical protein
VEFGVAYIDNKLNTILASSRLASQGRVQLLHTGNKTWPRQVKTMSARTARSTSAITPARKQAMAWLPYIRDGPCQSDGGAADPGRSGCAAITSS